MRGRRARRRGTSALVVNTHANGDHCWGNQLVRGRRDRRLRRLAPRRWPSCPRRCWPRWWPTRPRDRRRPGAQDVRRLRLRRHRGRAAHHHLRRRADAARWAAPRSGSSRSAPPTPGATCRPRARPGRRVHRRHRVQRRAPHRVGRAGGQLDCGLRPHRRARADHGRARHGPSAAPPRSRPCATTSPCSRARSGPGPRPASTRSRRPATSTSAPTLRTLASPSGSWPTSPPSTATWAAPAAADAATILQQMAEFGAG